MRRVDLPVKYALLIELLRFVPQDQHDLVLYIDARVIVVVVFRSCYAESGEDHVAGDLARGRKVERRKILLEAKRIALASRRVSHLVIAAKLGAGSDLKILVIAVAEQRLEVGGSELIANIGSGLF